MPTIEERLSAAVDYAVKLHEHDCYFCAGSGTFQGTKVIPCRCPLCDEKGRSRAGDRVCGLCDGTKEWRRYEDAPERCENCQGTGREVLPFFDPRITSTVFGTVITSMTQLRENEDYESMHRVLDWARQFQLHVAETTLSLMTEEDKEMITSRLKEVPVPGSEEANRKGVKVSGNPLTAEELLALGIEEDPAG